MALTSPRLLSPSHETQNGENFQSGTGPPRFNSGLPLQQPVSSASQMPGSPKASSVSGLLSTPQYIDQIRAVIEQQRQLHEKERALWNVENQALQEKVTQLEASLRWYKERNGGSEVISPLDDRSGMTFGTFRGFLPGTGSKAISASTGDEFWRGAGGKSDAVPTRAFSDPTPSSMKLENRQMPSIPEDVISQTRGRPLSTDTNMEPTARKRRMAGGKVDQNLDGIIFKPTSLPPAIVKSVMTPPSPSPVQSPSARVSPGAIRIPSNTLGKPEDPYTKDAGHTPLARGTIHSLDGTSSTGISPLTPTRAEKEIPPLEPHPSVARQPHERSDSYFPPIEESMDEDPELTGPLGLQNNEAEDKTFLNEVTYKLHNVAMSQTSSPPESTDTRDEDNAEKGKDESEGHDFEPDPDPEPKLRIKRSINFGSSWGAATCGKGI